MEVVEQLPVPSSGSIRRSTRPRKPPGIRNHYRDPTPEKSSTSHVRHTKSPSVAPSMAESTPSKRLNLRKRKEATMDTEDVMEKAMRPLTDEERREWQGWVELESNPELFNYILRQYGTKDVKVQEVLGLYDEAFAELPSPVYGLIFLYRYQEPEEFGDEEKKGADAASHIWFANQTINNACATIALLNIVMNSPEVDVGNNMVAFKAETQKVKPSIRGQKLGQHEFIRNIHNSFARRMDMLNSDLALSNEFEAWERAKKRPKKMSKKSSPSKPKKKISKDAGFHFVAYVPIDGAVWRLDGMQKKPIMIGPFKNNWLSIARDHIQAHIAQYADGDLNYNLLSLCRSPLCTLSEQLASNIKSIAVLERILAEQSPDWKLFLPDGEGKNLKLEPNAVYRITQRTVDEATPFAVANQEKLEVFAPTELGELRTKWMRAQAGLELQCMEETVAISLEDEKAERRKHDYTPVIYNSIKSLAEQGLLREIVQDIRASRG
ncbi:ubiquitin carboxyl-terminal hydrolase [Calycina marina]|uniref:Ubiquitin carboxyl-terminal hydrolase n=1 Tax=Calycina marina TaxID=1763456 RepID=A0A9P7ZCY3_9HELO|nr:ubiquitin carboxyl-terminal hydrolase [Calycina marina]